ncbi:MAG: hypothetical protein VW600_05830, partial [Ferrovibrio sp.]
MAIKDFRRDQKPADSTGVAGMAYCDEHPLPESLPAMSLSAASPVIIRPSEERDIAAIAAIYGHHVLHGFGSFEEVPPDAAEMARR